MNDLPLPEGPPQLSTLSLTEAPEALPRDAWSRWVTEGATDVNVGDLWLLSWNRRALAMVVITRVIDDYVLACPVTLPGDPSFAPAVVREDTPLGVPLTIWPSAETGLGLHLLRRNLGNLLSERTVTLLRRYAEDGDEAPLPVAQGDYSDDGNAEFLRELLGFMQGLCFHERPSEASEDTVLSDAVIRMQNTSIGFMTKTLGVSVARARQPLRQETSPQQAEVIALANAWHMEPADFLIAPQSEALRTLNQPYFKAIFERVSAERGYDEWTARFKAQQEFTLAARSESLSDPKVRLLAAIERLLHRADDAP